MNDSWDDYALEWDANDDVINYSEKAYKSLLQVVKIENKNILDFGCGTGLLTQQMASSAKMIVALDLSPKMISVLDSKNIRNVISISEPLTIDLINVNAAFENKFHIIVASSVFSFLPDYESTLTLLKSLLHNDGLLVQWDWLSAENKPEYGLTEAGINQALNGAGFKQISITKPFAVSGPEGSMPVVMGVAKNAG